MCGLVGVITKARNGFTGHQIDIFNTLLYLDALRGEDSTGAFVVNGYGNVSIVKEAESSGHTIAQKEYKSLTDEAFRDGWALIGHNRKATRGVVNDANAHPFWVDDRLVLVHNGTMFGDHKKHAEVEVDSHAIAHLIADSPSLEEALGKFYAAYALIWYDVQKKTLNFLRNSQRPLHFMETNSEVIYASEWQMLEFVRQRMNLTLKPGEKIYQLKEMTLLSMVLQDNRGYREDTKLIVPKEEKQEVVPYKGGTFPSTSERQHRYWDEQYAAACGYGDCTDYEWPKADIGSDAANDGSVGETEIKEIKKSIILQEKASEQVPVVRDTPRAENNVMPWMTTWTMNEYEELKKGYDKTQIVVEVVDYAAEDESQDKVFMIGKTRDKNNLFVSFPLRKGMADKLTNPDNPRNKENKPCLFKVEVDVFSWRRKMNKEIMNPNTTPGFITILGKNPLLTMDGNTPVQ